MKSGTIVKNVVFSLIGALALVSVSLLAQGDHEHDNGPRQNASQKQQYNALVKTVREVTEKYKNVAAAENDGYALAFGCVTGDASGAMGMHYVNMANVLDGELDANKPEIILYEPLPNGKLRLVGADYLVFADAWDAKHSEKPELNGQLFHYFSAPNRFGLPNFYTLHVWAWKDNPTGTFTNWHSNLSCDSFSGDKE